MRFYIFLFIEHIFSSISLRVILVVVLKSLFADLNICVISNGLNWMSFLLRMAHVFLLVYQRVLDFITIVNDTW